ncbi:MAG: chromosome condensation regulator RCC1 [Planctomycetota bacterium]|nr:chromosome condensation regulator RCC1 [Planctomycetota bacterium]
MIRTAGRWGRALTVAALAICLGACPGDGGRANPQPLGGTVRAWGVGGLLGDGMTTDSSIPVQVVDPSDPTGFLTGATAVQAGDSHTVALLGDGTVRTWGSNFYGQLGDGTIARSLTPVQVVDPPGPTGFLADVTAVSADESHTMALLGDGTLRAWGWNIAGQLGDGSTTDKWTPVQVVDPSDPTGFLTGVTAVVAGEWHTVALLGDGTLRAWGNNSRGGQLGDGTATDSSTPVQVLDPADPTGFLTGVTAVAAGQGHTVALLGDGTVRAWGGNGRGQIGDGTTTVRRTPVQVVDPTDPTGFLTGVTAVTTGSLHTVALLGDGTLRAWGFNEYGRLGDGTTTDSSTPVQVVDPSDPTGLLTGVTAAEAGVWHTVALLGDGTLRAWGLNFKGELGDGTLTSTLTPVRVVDPSDPTGFLTEVTAVAAGVWHTVALR